MALKLEMIIPEGNFITFNKEIKRVRSNDKIPVQLRWQMSKKSRITRFHNFMKDNRNFSLNNEIVETSSELVKSNEIESNIAGLSSAEIDKLMALEEKKYKEDAKGVRKLLEKNRKVYQRCYEKALLKDQLLNGVGKLTLKIVKGAITQVSSIFNGDGHKSAVDSLISCLDSKSKKLRVATIKGSHKVKFNLVFKS
jgi:molecular chaperone DnaK (HSP70)